jgi:hypothetical protein
MDTQGKREARREISMIKVVAANVVMDVLAIQVHKMVIARRELNHWAKEDEGASNGAGTPEPSRDAAPAARS